LKGWLLIWKFRRLLRRIRPVSVYVFDDRGDVLDLALLRECGRAGIRTILAPHALARREGRVFVRRRSTEYRVGPIWRAIIGRIGPGLLLESEGVLLSYYPPWDALGLRATGLLHPDPWTLGKGEAQTVAVLGEDDRDALIKEGVSPSRVVVTGQPSHDSLYRRAAAREALRVSLLRHVGDKLIVCAVPHQAEERLVDERQHRSQTVSLFESLGRVARGRAVSVILSLHPRSKRVDYAALAESFGLEIFERRLSEVLPAADIFVATWSSTVRWSVLMHIPSIVVDIPPRNYKVYDHLPSVSKVQTYEELTRKLERLIADTDYYTVKKSQAAGSAERMALFDGCAGRRLLELGAAT
jgi:hypothetical protein